MLRLVIEDGEGTTHVVPLIRDEITVGRQEGNTIRLTERNVSRRHARLTRTGTDGDPTVLLEDLHSYNGVRVNGERIVGKCSLAADDSIQIGDYLIGLEAKADEELRPPVKTVITKLPQPAPSSDAALPKEMFARLVVVSSNIAGQEYELGQRELIIGRHSHDDNDLAINHRSISRNHAKIIWREKRFIIIDLGSANGVIVNGEAIRSTASLVNGDIIEMGHVKLRFCGPADPYVFSQADIDDVLLPPPNPILRYVVPAVILVGMLLIGYVLTDALTEQNSMVNQRPIPKRTIAKVQKTIAKVQEPAVLPVAPVDATPKPVRVTPKPDFRENLTNGINALTKQDWEAAAAHFQRVLKIEPEHQQANLKWRKANAEIKAKRQFDLLKMKWKGGLHADALNMAGQFDQKSAYYKEVLTLKGRIQQHWVRRVTEDVRRHLKNGKIVRARAGIGHLKDHKFAASDRKRLEDEVLRVEKSRAKTKVMVIDEVKATPHQRIRSRVVKKERPKKAVASRELKPKTSEKLIARKRSCGELRKFNSALFGGKKITNKMMRSALKSRTKGCERNRATMKLACQMSLRMDDSFRKLSDKFCDRAIELTPAAAGKRNNYEQRIENDYRRKGWHDR